MSDRWFVTGGPLQANMEKEALLIFVCSTTGDGETPDNGVTVYPMALALFESFPLDLPMHCFTRPFLPLSTVQVHLLPQTQDPTRRPLLRDEIRCARPPSHLLAELLTAWPALYVPNPNPAPTTLLPQPWAIPTTAPSASRGSSSTSASPSWGPPASCPWPAPMMPQVGHKSSSQP
jgi:hypothetical protein